MAADPLLRVVKSVRLLTQIEQRITEMDFLIVKNLAVHVLLGTKFISDNVKTIFLGKADEKSHLVEAWDHTRHRL